MASSKLDPHFANLVAGWLCLGSAALNWWNMVGVGFTMWRIVPAVALTLIGFVLLFRRYDIGRA